MSGSWDRNYDHASQSNGSNQSESCHIERIYDALICPLTKQIMHDPVTLENGIAFERKAIETWFKECRENGRGLVCPVTKIELRSADLNPSIALQNIIKEWSARNEAAQLDIAQRSLTLESTEGDIIRGLKCVQCICQNSQLNKHVVRKEGFLPRIIDILKSSSRQVRCEALETLRISAKEDADIKVS